MESILSGLIKKKVCVPSCMDKNKGSCYNKDVDESRLIINLIKAGSKGPAGGKHQNETCQQEHFDAK